MEINSQIIKVAIAKNGDFKTTFQVSVHQNTSFTTFLQICSQVLEFRASRAFLKTGREIFALESHLSNYGNILYISNGNNFIPPVQENAVKPQLNQSDSQPDPNIIHICLLGHPSVGKTALARRYCLNFFSDKYQKTLKDVYKKELFTADQKYQLMLQDVGGEEELIFQQDFTVSPPDVVLLTFSILDMDSLNYAKNLYLKIYEKNHNQSMFILVGTKIDLKDRELDPTEDQNNNRKITGTTEAQQMKLLLEEKKTIDCCTSAAKQFSLQSKVPYVEVSSKQDLNVKLLFNYIVKNYIKKVNYQQNHEASGGVEAVDHFRLKNKSSRGLGCFGFLF